MSEPGKIGITKSERQFPYASLSPPQSHALPGSTDFRILDLRILELETENSRLQRLVAELLLKNQQLRKAEEQVASATDLSPVSPVFAS
jgi:hypothetical protein